MGRACVASIVRMFLFSAIGGVLAVLGEKDTEVLMSACFMLLSGNELIYTFGVMYDVKREQTPKARSRKKTKKVNPIRKYVIQLFAFEAVAGIVYWILYSNIGKMHPAVIVVTILVAALLSVLF